MSTTDDTLPNDFAGREELGSTENIEKLLKDLTPTAEDLYLLLEQLNSTEDQGLLLQNALAGFEGTNASTTEPPIDPNATPADVAQWMQQALRTDKDKLYHSRVVKHIHRFFGIRFLYKNNLGNDAIAKEVLNEYNQLTETTVVWVRSERFWRLRRADDPPTRSV